MNRPLRFNEREAPDRAIGFAPRIVRHAKTAAAVFATVLLAAPLAAEEILFKCFFDGVCDPDRMKCEASELDVRFKVDTETNEVEQLGGEVTSAYSLILGDRALTVLEVPFSGGTVTTTIPTGGGWSVHSVNGFNGADIAPKQYFGECTGV